MSETEQNQIVPSEERVLGASSRRRKGSKRIPGTRNIELVVAAAAINSVLANVGLVFAGLSIDKYLIVMAVSASPLARGSMHKLLARRR